MPYYTVNATVTLCGWLSVEADTPEAALIEAQATRAGDFETDPSTATVDFNVAPQVEED